MEEIARKSRLETESRLESIRESSLKDIPINGMKRARGRPRKYPIPA